MKTLCIVLSLLCTAWGHGRLADPASRSSAWRYGFDTPKNYDDTALYCGGVGLQYGRNGGKCGVCGDAYDAKSKPNEAGGKYATGTIVKTYTSGDMISVTVQVTANHLGHFEFNICPVNDYKVAATEDCFAKYPLLVDGRDTIVHIGPKRGMVTTEVKLPDNLVCSQCVLRWKYNTGNSWGTDKMTGKSCVGCGDQEQFYGCADVAITGTITDTKTTTSTKASTTEPVIVTEKPTASETTTSPGTTPNPESSINSSTVTVTNPPTTGTSTETSTSATTIEITSLEPTPNPESSIKSSTVTVTSPRTTGTSTERRTTTSLETSTNTVTSTKPTTPIVPETTTKGSTQKMTKPTSTAVEPYASCRAVPPFDGIGMDFWCRANCARRFCPQSHCKC